MQRFMGLFMVVAVMLAMTGFSLLGGRLYIAGVLVLAFAVLATMAFWKSAKE